MAVSQPLKLDHSANIYFSLTSDRSLDDLRTTLAGRSPSLQVVGPIGDGLLSNSIVVGLPKSGSQDDARRLLESMPGVRDVTLLETRQRAKRGAIPGEL